jgi:hypothetical protein
MQDKEQQAKINGFLRVALPAVAGVVRTFLDSFGLEFGEEGHGLGLTFCVRSGTNTVKFCLHNLLLEIATVNRDENPLRFDEGLRDFDYFLAKTTELAGSKLLILLQLLSEDDVDAAIEKVCNNKGFERIRVWKFDRNEPS